MSTVKMDFYLIHETEEAILVSEEGKDDEDRTKIWLPKSKCTIDGLEDDGKIVTEAGERIVEVSIPEWLAVKKGLV